MKKFIKAIKLLPVLLSLVILTNACVDKKSNSDLVAKDRPNIVLVMLDDVGFEHFENFQGIVPTPNINKLAKEGMSFTNAFTSSSACTPSRYTAITGQYAGRNSSEAFQQKNPKSEAYGLGWNTPLTKNNLTLHKVLRDAGYFTGFVGKFHMGKEHEHADKHENNPNIPIIPEDLDLNTQEADSLLQKYQQEVASMVGELTGAEFIANVQWENPEELPVKALRVHNLEWITEGAVEFLKKAKSKSDQPFFLNLNSTALHGPSLDKSLLSNPHHTPSGRVDNPYKYHPDRKTIFQRLKKSNINFDDAEDHLKHYYSGIVYMDDQIGVLMDKLKEYGFEENTLVILTADHNIEPGKTTVYDKGMKVPFIAKWPNTISENSTSDALVQFVDFLPTFSEFAGTKISSTEKVDGKSFAKVLNGIKSRSDREFLFFEQGYSRAVRNDRYKYIATRFPESVIDQIKQDSSLSITSMGIGFQAHAYITQEYHPGYFKADQLYDLSVDPYEQKNLAEDEKYKDTLELMQKNLAVYTNSFEHPFNIEDTDFSKTKAYENAVNITKRKGSSAVVWWDRQLDYPPVLGYPKADELNGERW